MGLYDNGPQTPASFTSAPPGYNNSPDGARPVTAGEKPWRARNLLWVGLVILAIVVVTYLR